MKVDVVVGANFGDESKGRIVARLAKDSAKPLVILTNGGAQRAHSIIKDGRTYTYKHFGSGTHFGADNYYSPTFILNPMQFVLELSENDIPANTVNWRHKYCRWTTPYDMLINQLKELARADKKHGSCGMGIWETVCRYNDPNGPKISFDDFNNLPLHEAENFLKKVRTYYERAFKDCGPLPYYIVETWYSSGIITAFIRDCKIMYSKTVRSPSLDHIIPVYTNIIFENGQGLLLTDPGYDKKGTTPSNTGLDDIISMLGQYDTNVIQNIDVHYVTRPYLTRHGNDDEFNEIDDRHKISSFIGEDTTNVYNVHQGKFKYSFLDINALSERIEKDFSKLQLLTNKNKIIELTHCDEMDRLSEFKNIFGSDIVVPTDSPIVF